MWTGGRVMYQVEFGFSWTISHWDVTYVRYSQSMSGGISLDGADQLCWEDLPIELFWYCWFSRHTNFICPGDLKDAGLYHFRHHDDGWDVVAPKSCTRFGNDVVDRLWYAWMQASSVSSPPPWALDGLLCLACILVTGICNAIHSFGSCGSG